MAIELIVLLKDDATEKEIKHVAAAIVYSVSVIGVFRQVFAESPADKVIHDTPRAIQ